MPELRSEEGGQLLLVDRDDVEDEEDCFESIDKRKHLETPLRSIFPNSLAFLQFYLQFIHFLAI